MHRALNPYSNKWTIRARITNKTDLRSVNTKNGDCEVFSMDLCDESGEIRATLWREAAVRFYKSVEVGKVRRPVLLPAERCVPPYSSCTVHMWRWCAYSRVA